MMIGKCICGNVQFEMFGEIPNLYQCHCKLCRKQCGSASNSATIINNKNFSWTTGEDKITYYKKDTGFSSNFCSTCGCPVPNKLGESGFQWIPAGLLEDDIGLSIVAHIYVDSKASWNEVSKDALCYETMPSLEEFIEVLKPSVK